jgi:ribosomal protein S18 acetylase RimI-like enzyme
MFYALCVDALFWQLECMTTIHIRHAVAQDIAYLPAIEEDAASIFSPDDLPQSLVQLLSERELHQGLAASSLWVAEEVNHVVGFLLGRAEGTSFHIVEMDVKTNYSRRGIGSALLKEACCSAFQSGFLTVTLTTFEHLAWDAAFYVKRGFQTVNEPSTYPHLHKALLLEASRGFKNRVAMVYSGL